jgi:nucleoside-diphosphate-sugar epimerase
MPVCRIFLTGATGYIGTALARRLRGEGHEVRALVRPSSNVAVLEELGVLTFVGDIGERVSMREAMSGADWAIHAAAELDLGAPAARMEVANVAGSENVASLACKLGVPRFLSVSSVAAFGGSPGDGSLAREETPPALPMPTRYSATKAAGERAIRQWAGRGLRVNTVFPGLVYGPPGKKRGANVLLRSIYLGRFPALVGADRRTSWVHLDDVVEALMLVMEKAPPGRGYILAGDVVTTRDLARRIESLGGARAPRVELPIALAKALLRLGGPLYALRGRRPPLPVEQMNSLRRHWAFSDERARRELGWSPRTLEAGLPATLEYLQRKDVA